MHQNEASFKQQMLNKLFPVKSTLSALARMHLSFVDARKDLADCSTSFELKFWCNDSECTHEIHFDYTISSEHGCLRTPARDARNNRLLKPFAKSDEPHRTLERVSAEGDLDKIFGVFNVESSVLDTFESDKKRQEVEAAVYFIEIPSDIRNWKNGLFCQAWKSAVM